VEAALGEALSAEPEALALGGQEFKGGAGAVTEDVDGPAQGLLAQRLTAEGRQPIYALAKVDGLHGEKETALRRELQPQRLSRKVGSSGVSVGEAS
jgi:hypothetical protein